jgi:hypothetical protein
VGSNPTPSARRQTTIALLGENKAALRPTLLVKIEGFRQAFDERKSALEFNLRPEGKTHKGIS